MYLLDTNVCIDFLKGKSSPLVPRMEAAFGQMAISAVTFAELAVGSRRSEDPIGDTRRIDDFAAGLDVLAFDEQAGRAYGAVVRVVGVKRQGLDRLIAAHAVARDLVLITNNERDFTDIPGLKVENWTL